MPSIHSIPRRPPTPTLITTLAVGAVTLAALAAAWTGFAAQEEAERPSLQEVVHIVKAPAGAH